MNSCVDLLSPPAWWCGLKLYFFLGITFKVVSPPAWWCGLKLWYLCVPMDIVLVTTCVVVWIEIFVLGPGGGL